MALAGISRGIYVDHGRPLTTCEEALPLAWAAVWLRKCSLRTVIHFPAASSSCFVGLGAFSKRAVFLTLALHLALNLSASYASDGSSHPPTTAEIVVSKFEESVSKGLRSPAYSEVRHYVLRNDRLNRESEMDVSVIRGVDGALDFTVLQVSGSEQIFRRILDGEKTLSRLPLAERSIGHANYEFKLLGSEFIGTHRCYVLELTPRRKSKYLLEGRAWIDTATFGLVRLEGRPAASLSFFIGRPLIVQNFEEVDGTWIASASITTAKTRLLGSSQLVIEHGGRQLLGETAKLTPLSGIR